MRANSGMRCFRAAATLDKTSDRVICDAFDQTPDW
jgi:hypothetical protein